MITQHPSLVCEEGEGVVKEDARDFHQGGKKVYTHVELSFKNFLLNSQIGIRFYYMPVIATVTSLSRCRFVRYIYIIWREATSADYFVRQSIIRPV